MIFNDIFSRECFTIFVMVDVKFDYNIMVYL